MRRIDTIRQTLEGALLPERLDIVDESDQHAGHVGAHPAGETHFRVTIVADTFAGLSRIERHRKVNDLLAGKDIPLHQVMITMQEAGVAFQLMVEVRNKLLEGYQELMRMQI